MSKSNTKRKEETEREVLPKGRTVPPRKKLQVSHYKERDRDIVARTDEWENHFLARNIQM